VTEIEPLTVSVDKAAKLLGISRAHCYNEVVAGKIPSFRIGRRRVISVQGLRQWVNEQGT
jgi:excisionase family DNA binding protein